MDGMALAESEVPIEFMERHRLSSRLHERGGERELRFLRREIVSLLPVLHAGQLKLVPWGIRHPALPRGGFTWLSTVEAGEWAKYEGEPVVIPASAGLHNGVWYRIHQGIQGILVSQPGANVVYVVVKPSTYYYRVMTKASRMPALVGEEI